MIGPKIREQLKSLLHQRRESGSLRKLVVHEGLADFSSNDYLGFATCGLLDADSKGGYRESSGYRGSTGSRLLSGNSTLAEEVEAEVAEHLLGDTALIFCTGYDANVGLFSALGKRGSTIIFDEYSHASVRDGIQMGFAKSVKFEHNNVADLRAKLLEARGPTYVAVEGLYSMDGDLAPLKELAAVCAEFGAGLIVDEAHSTGVYGEKGGGVVLAAGLQDHVFARVHTFGKALGVHGAAVVADDLLREYLVNFARSFIYSTAPSNHSFQMIRLALAKNVLASGQREKLWANINLFRGMWGEARTHPSPVQSIVIPGNAQVKAVANNLQSLGYDVRPVLSPTVPETKERLRISLHAHNTAEQIEGLVHALNRHASVLMQEAV